MGDDACSNDEHLLEVAGNTGSKKTRMPLLDLTTEELFGICDAELAGNLLTGRSEQTPRIDRGRDTAVSEPGSDMSIPTTDSEPGLDGANVGSDSGGQLVRLQTLCPVTTCGNARLARLNGSHMVGPLQSSTREWSWGALAARLCREYRVRWRRPFRGSRARILPRP